LQHISDWAKHHNLKLNQSKSLEIIISLRTPPTSAATFLTRIDSLTVLGVTFNSKLRFDLHVSNIIDKAARALYGLKTIRSHGLTGESLHDVTRATARLIYAAPAWWGFVSLAERDRIQSVINKAQCCGYLPRNFPDVSCLVDALETNLFNSILHNPNHVPHQLMPPEKITSYNLRERSLNLTIPLIDNNMPRKNFLYRLLFRDMY